VLERIDAGPYDIWIRIAVVALVESIPVRSKVPPFITSEGKIMIKRINVCFGDISVLG
jgi:hypothetical protein